MNEHELTMASLVADSKLQHIAFIMDGNGRWAKARFLPREAGHKVGADTFRTVVRYCKKLGIPICTVYAFSTENWNRPKSEISAIMRLLDQFIGEAGEEKDIAFRFIGDKSALEPSIQTHIQALEAQTAGRPFLLQIAVNYGGRAELVHAVNLLLQEEKTSVTEADISAHLYTSQDPDLIVRTGGEMRLSNFLLWQSAYAELYFTDTLWPDMKPKDVDAAIESFAGRKRRFGRIDTK